MICCGDGFIHLSQRAEASVPNGVPQSCNPEDYFWHPVFLPELSTLGSTGPIKKLRGGHEGEKRVTIFRYS